MNVDVSFLPALAAAFLLTFARVGTMVMLMPGVGELNLPSRVRLTIALVLTAILLPSHQKAYIVDLTALGPVLTLLIQEVVIGAVLGLTARLAISALQVAGSVVAQQLGLGFVTAIDPTQNQQGMLVVLHAGLAAPEKAEAILGNAGADYMVFCPGDGELKELANRAPEGLAAALLNDRPPAFLKEVTPAEATNLKVYRLVR